MAGGVAVRTHNPLNRDRDRDRVNGSGLQHHAFEWVADEVASRWRVTLTLNLLERSPPIKANAVCG
jgi:hypothetical protein